MSNQDVLCPNIVFKQLPTVKQKKEDCSMPHTAQRSVSFLNDFLKQVFVSSIIELGLQIAHECL